MFYTYVLKSQNNGRLYTGYASNLRKRFNQHNEKKSKYTKSRGPYALIYYEACLDEGDAKSRELYLKSGKGKRYLKSRLKRFLFRTGQSRSNQYKTKNTKK
jgi:putative endonuclease